jgi:hemoglobin
MDPTPSAQNPPFALLGGEDRVRRLVARFYEAMRVDEPALARLHECEPDGRVSQRAQDRFGLFLVGWLGGPQTYSEQNGHPRLRMRHGRVLVDVAMRDAWLRCMTTALDAEKVDGPLRAFLDKRFAEVADFLRNAPP